MAITMIPTIMRVGFLSEQNLSSSAAARRIFGPLGTESPVDGCRGFIMKARGVGAANAASIFVGSAAVAAAGAARGYDLPEGDALTGALTDSGAREVYEIAADADQEYYLGQVG